MAKINKITQDVLDFIFPLRCPISAELVDHKGMLSAEAWSALTFIESPQCPSCGHPFAKHLFQDYGSSQTNQPISLCMRCLENPPHFDQARSRLQYDDVSRALILKYKHGDQLHLIDSFMPFLKQAGENFIQETDLVIPVPLHRRRLLKRKYNQAALIAEAFAKQNSLNYDPLILTRKQNTPQQQGALTQRLKNVSKAFFVTPSLASKIQDKNILLIDDVFTTGSTVSSCAKVLKENGAKTVNVLTIAQVCHDI